MQVIVHNFEIADPAHLAKCLERISAEVPVDTPADERPPCEIFCAKRSPTGFLEYGIKLTYVSGRCIYVGAIQRWAGAEVEFHS